MSTKEFRLDFLQGGQSAYFVVLYQDGLCHGRCSQSQGGFWGEHLQREVFGLTELEMRLWKPLCLKHAREQGSRWILGRCRVNGCGGDGLAPIRGGLCSNQRPFPPASDSQQFDWCAFGTAFCHGVKRANPKIALASEHQGVELCLAAPMPANDWRK